MYCNGRRFFSIYFTVLVALVSFPFAAAAQTGDNRSSLVKTVTGAFSTDVSSDLLQDSSFLAAIKARDSEIALQTQLEEIVSFHEDLKDNLSILFGNLPIKLREYYQSMIDDELFRLKTLENDIKSGLYTIGEGAKNFEIGGYPLVLNEKVVIKIPQLSTTESPIEFARRGREKATEVFKNVAPENKQFLYDYQKIFSLMASFGISNMTVPLSQDLPPEFYKLAGAQSYNTIDEPQLKLAISKYEEVLKRTRNIVKSPPAVTTFITDVRSPVDALSRELQKRN